MGVWGRWWRRDRDELAPLYAAVVARARQPGWYLDGGVPDTVDGRFDMIAAVLSLVLIRLEGDPAGAAPAAALAERFVDDMDSQLREIGVGDVVVGKHVGRMMSMLGGRLGAYRAALPDGELEEALRRNLYRGGAPADASLRHAAAALRALHERLGRTPVATVLAGKLP